MESGGSDGQLKASLKIKTAPKIDATDGDKDEPLSPAGRMFHQPEFNCYVICTIGSAKPLDVEVIKKGLEVTLVRHPRFSSIVVNDGARGKKLRWHKTSVVIDDHIIVPDLDPPSSPAIADKVVEDYVASLPTTSMDYSRPLWELHILNFPTSTATAIVVFRLHHSLGDGISLISLLLTCTRKVSDPTSLPTLPQNTRPQTKNSKLSFSSFLMWLCTLLILAWNTMLDMLAFLATSMFLRDTITPLKGTKGVELRPKRFVHRSVNLDDIKDIKNSLNCTINDALLAVTSAGLSMYLRRKYGESEGDDATKKKQLPSNLRVRSTVLVNIRPSPGLHALSELMDGKNNGTKWGNLIGYLILPFTVMEFEDPIEYIRRAKALANRKKNSLEAIFTYCSANLIIKIFGNKAAAVLSNRVVSNTTFSFSNVLGPIEEIEFYGHPIVYLAPSVYGHPQALTIHYQSYMKKMTISLAVDELTIPDPHQLLDDFDEFIKLLKDALHKNS